MTVDFHLGVAVNTKSHVGAGACVCLCAHVDWARTTTFVYFFGEGGNIAVFVCNLPRHSKKVIVENEFRNQKYAWQ